jgi:hypothetical protein
MVKTVSRIPSLVLLLLVSAGAQQFNTNPVRVSKAPVPKAAIGDPEYRPLSSDERLTI